MRILRGICGPFFVFMGLTHFTLEPLFTRIVPPYLPRPRALVYASGVAEAVGGVGLIVPATRRLAGWWLIATVLAVFPANIHMARHPEQFPEVPGGRRALQARLPLQGAFVAWILSSMR
jgi:uncharacterized membrane protein